MAGRREANSLARKLGELDKRLNVAFLAEHDGLAEDLIEQQKRLIVEAKREGLKLVAISVGDGYALYFEAKRTTRLATFEWVWSEDGYVSDFGRVVSVPLEVADKLL